MENKAKPFIIDSNTLLVFKYFTNAKSDNIESVLIYDFVQGLNLPVEKFAKYDILIILNFLLLVYSKQKKPNDFYRFIDKSLVHSSHSTFAKEEYEHLISSNKVLLDKKPFSLFNVNISIDDSFQHKENFEIILQILSSYIYFTLFKYSGKGKLSEVISKIHPKQLTKVINKIEVKEGFSSDKQLIRLCCNYLRFYKLLSKVNKSMLYKNENFIEIILQLVIIVIHHNSNFINKNKNIFKYFCKQKLFKTLIMLMNFNKSNSRYCSIISQILSVNLLLKWSNLVLILDVFNSSNIGSENCLKLIKNIFLQDCTYEKNKDYYKRLINFIMKFIFIKTTNEVEEGLQRLFIDILITITNKMSNNIIYLLILFDYFYSIPLNKFGYMVNKNALNDSNLIVENDNPILKRYTFTNCIIKRMKFIIDNFSLLIKTNFNRLVEIDGNSLIKVIINILTKLWSRNKIFYDNLMCEDLKTIQTFFSIVLDNYELYTLSLSTIKFFTKKLFSKLKSENFKFYNFEIDILEGKVTIERNILEHDDLNGYISSTKFEICTLNSIENILNVYPFKSQEFLSEMLDLFIEEKINLESDSFEKSEEMECTDVLKIVAEPKLDDQISSIKIKRLQKLIKYKFLIVVLNSLNIIDEYILNNENAINIILFMLKNSEDIIKYSPNSSDINLEEQCLNLLLLIIEKLKNQNKIIKSTFDIILTLQPYLGIYESAKNIIKILNLNNLTNVQELFVENPNYKIEINEIINSKIIELMNKNSNVDRAFILKDISKVIIKNISLLKKKESNSYFDNNLIKKIYETALNFYKKSDSFLAKSSQELSLNLFEYVLAVKKLNKRSEIIEFFFNLILTSYNDNLRISDKNNDESLISFNTQTVLKLTELLQKIIKKSKSGTILFLDAIMGVIFSIFDEFYSKLDPTVISALISVISSMVNYCGFQMSNHLNTLIRTSLNAFSTKSHIEIKRSCAFLIFKIIQNCDFSDYKDYAITIYKSIKHNIEVTTDKVLVFHLDKIMKIIRESVSEFYEII